MPGEFLSLHDDLSLGFHPALDPWPCSTPEIDYDIMTSRGRHRSLRGSITVAVHLSRVEKCKTWWKPPLSQSETDDRGNQR